MVSYIYSWVHSFCTFLIYVFKLQNTVEAATAQAPKIPFCWLSQKLCQQIWSRNPSGCALPGRQGLQEEFRFKEPVLLAVGATMKDDSWGSCWDFISLSVWHLDYSTPPLPRALARSVVSSARPPSLSSPCFLSRRIVCLYMICRCVLSLASLPSRWEYPANIKATDLSLCVRDLVRSTIWAQFTC